MDRTYGLRESACGQFHSLVTPLIEFLPVPYKDQLHISKLDPGTTVQRHSAVLTKLFAVYACTVGALEVV